MTSAPAPKEKTKGLKGWHVGLMVTGFFAVIIAADALFLTLAYRTHPGQVAAKPYEAGLAFNADIARRRAQTAQGWNAQAGALPDGVSVVLSDAGGQPLAGRVVHVALTRPATEHGALNLTLAETAPGQYAARRPGLAGAYDAVVTVEGDAVFRAERRLIWR